MGYRGRLIFPFIAVIYRLDTAATETAGYDPVFRTPKKTYPGNIGVSQSTRRELGPVELRCQVEDSRWEQQRQMASGNAPDTSVVTVFHMKDLELAGLVDLATGDPKIRVNDRLDRIKRVRDGALVQVVRKPQGLYATEVRPSAYGIGRERNLLIVTWDERPQGLVSPPG